MRDFQGNIIFKEGAIYNYSKEFNAPCSCDKCKKTKKENIKFHTIKEDNVRCLTVCQDCLDSLNIKY